MAQCLVPNGMQYAINAAVDERERQDAKWGPQDHALPVWMAILMEEVGELSECLLHRQFGGHAAEHLRKEAVQVAAVALALVQAIDEGRAWDLGRTAAGHTAGKPKTPEGRDDPRGPAPPGHARPTHARRVRMLDTPGLADHVGE